MIDYHSEFYKLVVVTGGQDYKVTWTHINFRKYYAKLVSQHKKELLSYKKKCVEH